jgi:hypothetical protein
MFNLGKAWSTCTEGPGQVATLKCIPDVFQNLVTTGLTLAGVLAVFLIVYGGIRFVTSGGDPKQVEGARSIITWALVGLILVFLSYFIITAISYLTGVSCIQAFGFDSCR